MPPSTMPTDSTKVNRRHFIRQASRWTMGGAAAAGFYSWQIEPHWVDIVEQPMPLRGLPAALQGKRVVQISDLHVSAQVSHAYLQRAVAQAAELKPDVVLITGDLMTSHYLEQVAPLVGMLKQLKPDNCAVFAIPGNHDYGQHCQQANHVDVLTSSLQQVGIKMLRNETVEYEGLQIVGFDEVCARRFKPTDALMQFDATREGIAMTHNPDTVDFPGWQGFGGWVLAGHTHGGQCRLPYFGAPIVPIKNRRYIAGNVTLNDGRRMYINRGLGYTRRVRFLCSPEITLFRLTAAA